MSPEVAGLFRKLADLSPQARERYFADHPVDDRTRRDVEELLAHDSTGGDRFTHIVGLASMNLLYDDTVGKRCGPFRLVNVIGRGGMGVVYLAERADGEVRQRAAVKLMNPGWGDFQRERFLQEREILAALSHANIARLLDAGHLDDGQPYLAMEYVDGRPIHEYCAGFSVRQKIELFLKVCRAVAYLHSNSVIHRDLKPSNIVVPADGEPKLLDFGIAKMLDLQTDATITHLRMLTPDYASPEQLGGGEVGKRSDIYSLGIVLHRLLTGKLPGELGKGYSAPELKGDLGRVLQTALRKDPEERYPSVELFAGDLQACLESRPIRARRGNWVYRTKRFVLRHSLSVALTSSLVLALIVVGAYAWNRANSPAALKEFRPRRLTSNTPELPIHSAAISPDGRFIAYSDPLGVHVLDATGSATRLLPDTTDHVLVKWMPGGSTLQTAVPGPNGQSATMLVPVDGGASVSVPNPDSASVSPDGKHRAIVSADGKSLLLQDAHGGNSRELWRTDQRTFNGFEWSPDSRRLCLITSTPGASILEVIDIASGRLNALISGDQKLQIGSLVWPVQNRIIAAIHERAAGANSEGSSNLWEIGLSAAGDSASGPPRRLTAWSDFPIRPGSLTTDGKKLVLIRSFRQRDVYVAPINPGRQSIGPPRRFTLDLGDDYPTAWTRDSKSVIFTSDRNGPSAVFVQRLDKPTAELLVAGGQSQIVPRLSPDGASVLFYGRMNGKRGLFRSPVTGRTAELFIESNTLLNHRCSPAGPCVMAERQEGTTVVYEMGMKSGKGREIYRDTSRRIATPDVSPDGKWLATASGSNIVIRSFVTGAIAREIPVRGVPNGTSLISLDYAHDGRGFFAGDLSPTQTRLLHIDLSGKASLLWRQAGYSAVWGVPSPDGKYIAMMVFADDSNVYVLDSF